MTVLVAGGGIGGLTLALSLHQIGISVRVFESVAELKPPWRRHQRPAACGARADRARLPRRARSGRRAHKGTRLFLETRQADLERAARAGCRLQVAAVFHPSRPAAQNPA